MQNQSSPTNDIRKIFELVGQYARGAWRYRWAAISVTWLLALTGWLYVFLLPNIYGASATVYVDTESVLRPLLQGLSVELDVMNDVEVMTRAITSRPTLEVVARHIDLDLKAEGDAEYERLLDGLEQRIQIIGNEEGIYSLLYEDVSRETALEVVRKLLDTFVEDTLGNKTDDSDQAEEALRQQLEQYELRLTDAENRLKEFKRHNIGMMPDDRGDYYSQLQSVQVERDTVQETLRIERKKQITLERQLVGEEPVFGLMTPVTRNAGTQSALDIQISELEQRLTVLTIDFTDQHPEVARVRERLESMRAERAEELSRIQGSSTPVANTPLDLNPVYQNLKIELSTVQVEVTRLEATLTERDSEVLKLQEMVDVIPQVEAELTRLNRDYDVVQNRYTEMLERWENLQTTMRVNEGSDSVQFRVIEPPYALTEPEGPERVMLVLAFSVLAVGVGIGGSTLLAVIRPVIGSRTTLEQLGFPVVGSVSLNSSSEATRLARLGHIGWTTCCLSFVMLVTIACIFAQPVSQSLRQLVS